MWSAHAYAPSFQHDREAKPGWHFPSDELNFGKKKVDDSKDKSPTTGRNTKLGRRVEKPQDPKAGGPSGQRDRAKHDKKHANK